MSTGLLECQNSVSGNSRCWWRGGTEECSVLLGGNENGTVTLKEGLEGRFPQGENGLEDGLEEMV